VSRTRNSLLTGTEDLKQIERVYVHLIQNATKDQIELTLDHLKLEVRADNLIVDNTAHKNDRLMTSMDCLLLFLVHTPGTFLMRNVFERF